MKQLTRFLGGALLFLMPLAFTSCGEADNPVQPQPSTPTTEEETKPEAPTYASALEQPLTFKAAQDNVKVTLKFNANAKPDFKKVEFSLDQGATWTPLSSPSQAILLKKEGDIVMFRGDNATYNGDAQFVIETAASNARGGTRIDLTGILAFLSGNFTSLLTSDDFAVGKALTPENAGAFMNILKGAPIDVQSQGGEAKLILPEIGAAVPDAFKSMFEGSTITVAPAIVAQLVGEGTLADTFKGCSNLGSVKLDIAGVAEGVTTKQAMGGMLDGAGESAKNGLVIRMVPYTNDPSGNIVYQPGTVPITLDGIIIASDLSEAVLQNASVTLTDPETGKTSEAEKIVLVTDVKLDQHELELTVNTTATLKATVTPEDATDKSIVWTSSDEKVVTVDASGFVKAVAAGKAKIYAKHSEVVDSCGVIVKEAAVAVTGVTLDKETLELETGATATLTATVAPTDATTKDVTWTSSDTKVVTVVDGKVTAVAAGEATITVTTKDGSKTATCKVTVTNPGPTIGPSTGYEGGGDPTQPAS